MKCRIADFNIELFCRGRGLKTSCQPYLADFEDADFTLRVTDEDIDEESRHQFEEFSKSYLESVAAYRKLCSMLPERDAFILHAATFEAKGKGIAFLAKSGTGKSTHMLLWQKLLLEDFHIINGDKPIVRIIDGNPYAYGTPWCGKEGLADNRRVLLTDLCFIKRSEENKVVRLDKGEAVNAMLRQIVMPKGNGKIVKIIEMLDAVVNKCNIWEIYCNTDISAAETSIKAILEERENEA